VLSEQRIGAFGASVGLRRRYQQNATHRLQIQRQLSDDRRLRSPVDVEQAVHFPPAVLAGHAPLPEWCDLEAGVAVRRRQSAQRCQLMNAPSSVKRVGNFQRTRGANYWMTADRAGRAPVEGCSEVSRTIARIDTRYLTVSPDGARGGVPAPSTSGAGPMR